MKLKGYCRYDWEMNLEIFGCCLCWGKRRQGEKLQFINHMSLYKAYGLIQ